MSRRAQLTSIPQDYTHTAVLFAIIMTCKLKPILVTEPVY